MLSHGNLETFAKKLADPSSSYILGGLAGAKIDIATVLYSRLANAVELRQLLLRKRDQRSVLLKCACQERTLERFDTTVDLLIATTISDKELVVMVDCT